MEYRDRHALFCAHARAVFGGDTAEAHRLRRLIHPSHLLAHQVFAFALFTVCVDERFGEDLDWASMEVLLEGVRRTAPGVSPLKTEALIRACYDEPHLIAEVPQSEHAASFWAVCRLVVDDGADLDELFERAEKTGRDVVRGIFAASQRYARQDAVERIAPEHGASA